MQLEGTYDDHLQLPEQLVLIVADQKLKRGLKGTAQSPFQPPQAGSEHPGGAERPRGSAGAAAPARLFVWMEAERAVIEGVYCHV